MNAIMNLFIYWICCMKHNTFKTALLIMVIAVVGSGCQSYPKNPSKPSFTSKFVDINSQLPKELEGISFELVRYYSLPPVVGTASFNKANPTAIENTPTAIEANSNFK